MFGAVVAREGGVILRSARSLHALPVVVLSGVGWALTHTRVVPKSNSGLASCFLLSVHSAGTLSVRHTFIQTPAEIHKAVCPVSRDPSGKINLLLSPPPPQKKLGYVAS